MKKLYTISFLFLFVFSAASLAQCPQFCFTASSTNGCKGLTVTFTNTSTDGTIDKLVWNFGDGSPTYTMTVPTATVSHTYTASGYYSPVFNAYNAGGSYIGYSYGNSGNIQVSGFAGIGLPDTICPGDLTNMCTNTNGGSGNYSTSWNFGDGGTANSNFNCTSHTYTAQGTYTITAYGSVSGCPIDSVKEVVVAHPNGLPDANWWTYGQSPFCPNQQIGFNTSPASSYTWNFGDGATASVQSPTHSYTASNTYSVTLTKLNGCGKLKSATYTISINSNVTFPNQSWFQLQVHGSPICPNSQIGFDAPGGYSSYVWNFGDGSPQENTSQQFNDHTYGSTLGTYTVSVQITNACNNDTTLYGMVEVSATAPFPNQSWFKIDANSPACPNTETYFDAPGGFSNYVWNFGDGSTTTSSSDNFGRHTYTSIGTYTVSCTITNGCNNDTTIYTLMQISNSAGFPSGMQLYLGNPYCISTPVEIEAQSGFSNYSWNFGDGATALTTKSRGTHTYTATGTYTVSCQITNGCGQTTTLYGTVVVDSTGSFPNGNNMQIEVSPQNQQSCPNDIVSFSINSNVYTSYDWNFGDGVTATTSGREIQHTYTANGTYTVSCKITNGCGLFTTIYTSVTVSGSAPVNPGLHVVNIQNPSCIGDKVYMIPQEGQSSYSYFWDFGDGGKDTTGGEGAIHAFTANGNHTVTVTATNGCGSVKTITFVDTVKSNATPKLTQGNGQPIWGIPGGEGGGTFTAGCAGDAVIFYFMGEMPNNVWDFGDGNTGTATEHMVVSGGDGNTYPVTIIKHAYAANGTYTISLTLTNNCGNSASDTMLVNIGGNLQVDGEMSTSPPPFTTCAPIDFIGFGGANYLWDFGDGNTLNSTSPTVSHTYAAQGVYVATVVMTNGCGNQATYSKSISVTGVGGPAVALSGSVTPTCVNASNGSATVNVTSGQMPYTYLWDDANAQTTASATGLSAGIYNVVVTDGFGCPSNLVVQLNDPAPMVLASSTTKAGCGIPSGSATVTITSGGTAPFSYSWSNGATTAVATGLGYGQYPVTVIDANSCTSATNVSVSENGGAAVATNTVTNVSCFGSSTGMININVTGGTPPYVYSWSNGATTQDISGLAAGTYSVLVTDGGSCVATYNASVSQAAAIVASTAVTSAPTCGNFDGKATASATGGTSPYTYVWDANAANQTTAMATGLPAGSYSVIISDANGCSSMAIASLSNSNAPVISSVVSNVSCFGGSNGSIDLTVTGGTSPYLYTWNVSPPQDHNQDVFGLAPGQYFVSVNDKMGCQSYQLFNITAPAVLSATATNTGASCGNNDGSATASVSGGNTPYTYVWSAGQSAQVATGLALGNYTVNVTDSKGCTASATTSVTATAMPVNICGITVDNSSTKNVIVWQKPVATNIDSFKIYRLINSVYTYVGHTAYTDSSYFTDNTNGVNPNTAAYKYEIRTKDSCGNESVLSPFHQTIHLQVSVAAPPNSFNLSWNDYLGFPVTQYRIMVDSLNNGNWKARDSVSFGNPLTWTDSHHYPDTVAYMIEIALPGGGCAISIKNPEPMASNLNLSKSNINRVQDTTLNPFVKNITQEMNVSLYPNPSKGIFTIEMKDQISGSVHLKVFNMLGDEVSQLEYVSAKNRITVDMGKQPKGVYYIQVSSKDKLTTRKIIID